MYFYEEGECITNTESALTKPSAFAKEENEKVVYFQNGCLTKIRVQQGLLSLALFSSWKEVNFHYVETTTTSAQSTADTDTESSEITDESDPAAEKGAQISLDTETWTLTPALLIARLGSGLLIVLLSHRTASST